MIDRWYYAHDSNKIGPFSGRQMMHLALAGDILQTDTIWKEGMEKGVLATKVQYLFPAAHAEVSPVGIGGPPGTVLSAFRTTASTPSSIMGLPAAVWPSAPLLSSAGNAAQVELRKGKSTEEAKPAESSDPGDQPAAEFPNDIELQPETGAPVNPSRTSPQHQPILKRRAVGVRGAVIIGQDGARVIFRKKCTACGFEDSSWNTMPITIGSMKVSFFCPKCRKRQGVEIRGSRR
jgi:hypothetical protein